MATFTLVVSHGQLAVFDSRLTNPFNDWSDDHVGQGFSWRPGSVSFATLEVGGEIEVTVVRAASDAASASQRVIAVPFSVPAHGELEVATIGGSVPLQLPGGEYELVFEHALGEDSRMWARLSFLPVSVPVKPRILIADPGLLPPPEFVMRAEAA